MDSLTEKERQLQRKNEELEARKRQIEAELKKLEEAEMEEVNEENNEEEDEDEGSYHEKEDDQIDGKVDIIGQIEGVRKIQEQRNQERAKELKKIFEQNRNKIQKNK